MIPRSLLDIDPASLPAEEADVLVVGSGVAGLSTALAPELLPMYEALAARAEEVPA